MLQVAWCMVRSEFAFSLLFQSGDLIFFVVSQPQPQALPIIELHTFSHIVMDFDTIPTTTNGHFFAKYLFILKNEVP